MLFKKNEGKFKWASRLLRDSVSSHIKIVHDNPPNYTASKHNVIPKSKKIEINLEVVKLGGNISLNQTTMCCIDHLVHTTVYLRNHQAWVYTIKNEQVDSLTETHNIFNKCTRPFQSIQYNPWN